MNQKFIDANVLLEIILGRRLAKHCAEMVGDSLEDYAISALTVHIVWYIVEKYKLDQDRVDDVLSAWEILPIGATSVQTARLRYEGKDFEDCLQAACAEEASCGQIITLDKNFQKYSKTTLPVLVIS